MASFSVILMVCKSELFSGYNRWLVLWVVEGRLCLAAGKVLLFADLLWFETRGQVGHGFLIANPTANVGVLLWQIIFMDLTIF